MKLDGLAAANYVQSPDGRGMMESFGKWNMSYLHLDEQASPEQRTAREAIGNIVLPFAGALRGERPRCAVNPSQRPGLEEARQGGQIRGGGGSQGHQDDEAPGE